MSDPDEPVDGSAPSRSAAAGDYPGEFDPYTEATSRLAMPARRALVSLLTNRFITRSRNRAAWDAVLDYESEIGERLDDMFMTLEVDRDYEVAFKRKVTDDDVPVMLRRDKPLSRDASFVLIFLRREHAYTDAADDPVIVSNTQIADFLRPFRESGDADDAKYERRVSAAIRAVADLGLLTQDTEADYLYTVSPAVVPLVSLDVLTHMEQVYLEALSDPEAAGTTDEPAGTPAAEQPNDPNDDDGDTRGVSETGR
ncbi:DUF4194 domain-containing protein [Kribbella sp. NPDC023972]|uniref:DUF4194 domain-containing protein n=1 Tax=Kribbella sp. NPDC023972 TaxID=3154795 RepID=UPI0033D261AC